MPEVDRDWLYSNLRQTLSLLAADGDFALAAFPEGCCKPDELAIDYNLSQSATIDWLCNELPVKLVAALSDVTALLGRIRNWTEEAVRSDKQWTMVREQARETIQLLDQFMASDRYHELTVLWWDTV